MIILTTFKQYYLLSDHSKQKEHGTTTAFGFFSVLATHLEFGKMFLHQNAFNFTFISMISCQITTCGSLYFIIRYTAFQANYNKCCYYNDFSFMSLV